HALRFERDECRTQHGQSETNGRGRVETERHRGYRAIPCSLRQSESHPGIDEVADQNTERGAGKHPFVNDVGWKLESEDEDPGEERQYSEVVEREAEKAVDVSDDEPIVTCWPGLVRRLVDRLHGFFVRSVIAC